MKLETHVPKLLFVLLLFCSACNSKKEQDADIRFNKTKWNEKSGGNYKYRKHMIKDLLNNYQWAGIKRDSVIKMLGEPDGLDEGNLLYD
ncbi:MAG: hypothetical protein WCF67_04495, partial [Chitinophagaceae bacterium]